MTDIGKIVIGSDDESVSAEVFISRDRKLHYLCNKSFKLQVSLIPSTLLLILSRIRDFIVSLNNGFASFIMKGQ